MKVICSQFGRFKGSAKPRTSWPTIFSLLWRNDAVYSRGREIISTSCQRAAIIRHIFLRREGYQAQHDRVSNKSVTWKGRSIVPRRFVFIELIAEECREKNLLATNRRRSSCRKNAERNVFKIRVCLWPYSFKYPLYINLLGSVRPGVFPVILFSWYEAYLIKIDEPSKSSNDGNSADSEGGEESEIGDRSLNSDRSVKLHNQPLRPDALKKHDPNR